VFRSSCWVVQGVDSAVSFHEHGQEPGASAGVFNPFVPAECDVEMIIRRGESEKLGWFAFPDVLTFDVACFWVDPVGVWDPAGAVVVVVGLQLDEVGAGAQFGSPGRGVGVRGGVARFTCRARPVSCAAPVPQGKGQHTVGGLERWGGIVIVVAVVVDRFPSVRFNVGLGHSNEGAIGHDSLEVVAGVDGAAQ